METQVPTTMAVEIKFTINVDPGVWAGPDSDTMTTREVASEVQQWIERNARGHAYQEGMITADERDRRDN